MYKPRKASIHPNYTHYSTTQRNAVLQIGQTYLNTFGYTADNTDINTIALPQPIVRCLNKGQESILKVNDGPVCRELTEQDPFGRGFPWKMKIREVVMLEGKSDPGAVNQQKWLAAQAEKNLQNQSNQENPFANHHVRKEELPKELIENEKKVTQVGKEGMEEE